MISIVIQIYFECFGNKNLTVFNIFFKVILDDSTINIATIASSRYVGPLKTRVDEWQKQLSLFSQTLVSITLQMFSYHLGCLP